MGKFADAIRTAIEHHPMSRYAIARKVGISEASLGRFVAGSRGLNLLTVDKLADLLGLDVMVNTAQLDARRERGRPKKQKADGTDSKWNEIVAEAKWNEKMDELATSIAADRTFKSWGEDQWKNLAEMLAVEAYETNFQSRRGIFPVTDLPTKRGVVLCVYNNNPYQNHPTLRDDETARFRQRIKKAKIRELGYATYPHPGEKSAGYTYAMILDAGEPEMSTVRDAMRDVVRESFERLK